MMQSMNTHAAVLPLKGRQQRSQWKQTPSFTPGRNNEQPDRDWSPIPRKCAVVRDRAPSVWCTQLHLDDTYSFWGAQFRGKKDAWNTGVQNTGWYGKKSTLWCWLWNATACQWRQPENTSAEKQQLSGHATQYQCNPKLATQTAMLTSSSFSTWIVDTGASNPFPPKSSCDTAADALRTHHSGAASIHVEDAGPPVPRAARRTSGFPHRANGAPSWALLQSGCSQDLLWNPKLDSPTTQTCDLHFVSHAAERGDSLDLKSVVNLHTVGSTSQVNSSRPCGKRSSTRDAPVQDISSNSPTEQKADLLHAPECSWQNTYEKARVYARTHGTRSHDVTLHSALTMQSGRRNRRNEQNQSSLRHSARLPLPCSWRRESTKKRMEFLQCGCNTVQAARDKSAHLEQPEQHRHRDVLQQAHLTGEISSICPTHWQSHVWALSATPENWRMAPRLHHREQHRERGRLTKWSVPSPTPHSDGRAHLQLSFHFCIGYPLPQMDELILFGHLHPASCIYLSNHKSRPTLLICCRHRDKSVHMLTENSPSDCHGTKVLSFRRAWHPIAPHEVSSGWALTE